MPRKLRVEICGYHHIYNRGVAKNNIFRDNKDREKFIEILAMVSKEYKFNIHSFCLMNNHYHLLVENKKENLSDGMRQINSQYATYFNKKYKRVGHFWQGRYNSWYVFDENYLFTLYKYIESNPVKAHLSDRVGEHKYSSSYTIFKDSVPPFLQNSFVLRDYNTRDLFDMLNIPMTKTDMENIDNLQKAKFIKEDENIVHVTQKSLESYFLHVKNREERNIAIQKAYKDDYTKSQIARKIGLSPTGVTNILKKFKVET